MKTNKSAKVGEVLGREGFRKNHGNTACEEIMNNLAINPRVSEALKLLPLLCPTCQQLLTELLTTRGLGCRGAIAAPNPGGIAAPQTQF